MKPDPEHQGINSEIELKRAFTITQIVVRGMIKKLEKCNSFWRKTKYVPFIEAFHLFQSSLRSLAKWIWLRIIWKAHNLYTRSHSCHMILCRLGNELLNGKQERKGSQTWARLHGGGEPLIHADKWRHHKENSHSLVSTNSKESPENSSEWKEQNECGKRLKPVSHQIICCFSKVAKGGARGQRCTDC